MNFLRRTFSRHAVLWAVLFYGLLAVVMTWPLAARMGGEMVGEIGDNIYFVWMIGWIKKALFELGVNPFDVWFLNYPEGWNMAYTEITPIQLALAMPFALLTNNATLAYNLVMLLGFVLSGLGMFLWVCRLTGHNGAALLAGMIFGFIPYRFAHFLIGHLNLSGTHWLPFYFMGLTELLGFRRQDAAQVAVWKPVVLTGVSLGLIALTSQYYLYMAVWVSALMVVCYLLFMDRSRWRDAAFWKQMVAAGLVALPLVALAVAPYAALSQAGGLPDRGISIVRRYSASPTDFILPSTDHFLWGRWVGDHFNRELWIEGTLYFGAVSGGLALLAFLKRRELNQGRLLKLLLGTAALSVLLAMGTDLHWNGAPVELRLPAFLVERFARDTLPIILPGYILFYVFPFYAKMRALMRFGVFALLLVSAAAGLGAAWLLEKAPGRWRAGVLVALLALVFVDFYPGPYDQFAPVAARPVDHWLAEQPDGVVAQMPFSLAEDQEHTYYTLIHGKPYIGGFFNAFPPPQYQRIIPLLAPFPDESSVALLRDLGVQYVLVDVDEYDLTPEALKAICEELNLYYLDRFEDQLVFEVR